MQQNQFILTDAVYLLVGHEDSPKVRRSLINFHCIEAVEDISKERPPHQTRIILKSGEDFLSQLTLAQWTTLIEQAAKHFADQTKGESDGQDEESSEEESAESESEST